jgi:hypothetical protein
MRECEVEDQGLVRPELSEIIFLLGRLWQRESLRCNFGKQWCDLTTNHPIVW